MANAAWPVRFERWHGLGLFAAVSLLIVLFSGDGQPSANGSTKTAMASASSDAET